MQRHMKVENEACEVPRWYEEEMAALEVASLRRGGALQGTGAHQPLGLVHLRQELVSGYIVPLHQASASGILISLC